MKVLFFLFGILANITNTYTYAQISKAIYKLSYKFNPQDIPISDSSKTNKSLEATTAADFLTQNIQLKVSVTIIDSLNNDISLLNNSNKKIQLNFVSNNSKDVMHNGIWQSTNKQNNSLTTTELEIETFTTTNTTKQIKGYTCYLATSIENKNCYIWYCPSLPQSMNPGINCPSLPHGIVEYNDEENNIYYQLVEVR